MMNTVEDQSISTLLPCFILAISYVGSLYLTGTALPRDHPQTIKRRMIAVFIVCLLGPVFVFWCMDFKDFGFFLKQIGLHLENIVVATVAPLCITIILFLGPIVLYFVEEGLTGFKNDFLTIQYLKDLKWYRTIVVAPISEELIFRACMLPLLVPKFGLGYSIFIAPLFFGTAHFHHIIEELRKGNDLVPVVLISCFQMSYTTLFGAYSAFIFLRTGHLIGPILCHSFCNMMEFPDFGGIPQCDYPKLVSLAFVGGLLMFLLLLFPFTAPALFGSMYWA